MSLYKNQIEQRKEYDRHLLEKSFVQAAECVYGQTAAREIADEHVIKQLAIDELLRALNCDPVEIPDEISEDEQLDFCLRRYGIMRRTVTLEKKWYKEAFGPILAFEKESRRPVVLTPGGVISKSYYYREPGTGKVRINGKMAERLDDRAYAFCKPFPQKTLTRMDILKYMNGCMHPSDKRTYIIGVLLVTFISMLIPMILRTLLADFAASAGNERMLVALGICMICVLLSIHMIGAVNDSIIHRIRTEMVLSVQSAMMMRFLGLPSAFFRNFNTGELASIMAAADELCEQVVTSILALGVSAMAGFMYLFHPSFTDYILTGTAVVMVLLTVGYGVLAAYIQSRINRRKMELAVGEAGIRYDMISGVQKIKLSGAEKRFFARWLEQYSKSRAFSYNPPVFVRSHRVIILALTLISNIILMHKAAGSYMSPEMFLPFMAVFGLLMGSIGKLTEVAAAYGRTKPILELIEGILRTEPENTEEKHYVTDLSGSIDLNHVYFRYDINSPYLLKDVSLSIRPGEYIAVVGRTGCGKSTLMKLMLGIEKPEKGGIYFDGITHDLSTIDLSSLRQRIGTVLQGGQLFQGDIFQNISIAAPGITEEDAWKAAEIAGIADDIRAMPMGMHTLISPGEGGISGGQKQRILIARAIAGKPRILMFDEATSALDNRTQRQVSNALDRMNCTRIVIAHRLSTIRHCDRIIVLDGGRIIEDGDYEQLIKNDGFFAELVRRQRLDT